MLNAQHSQARWRKSSHSGDTGESCVEVAPLPHTIAVRDSKLPTSPVHEYSPSLWDTFVDTLKHSATV